MWNDGCLNGASGYSSTSILIHLVTESMAPVGRLIAYVWTGPNTALGLLAGAVVVVLGGRARLVAGVLEIGGGLVGRCLARLPAPLGFSAMTLGHVVLGESEARLCECRSHERVHVRQYERWGPFFLPAYVLSSAWQLISGGNPYRDNFFEKQAYGGAWLSRRSRARPHPPGDE